MLSAGADAFAAGAFLLLTAAGCGSFTAPGGTDQGFFDSGGVRLRYALDFPQGDGPFPAVVVGHGSGEKTRNEHTDWAEALVNRGVAVLRYDKRGVGESGGTYQDWGADQSYDMVLRLAGDMRAGVEFLRGQARIDPARIGLMGPSQAGWIIPEAASGSADVRFAVIKSGSPLPVGVNTYYESLTRGGKSINEASLLLDGYTGTRGYDPAPVLQSLSIPVYWMLGGKDKYVPPGPSRAVLEDLQNTHQRPITILFLPNGDHGVDPDWAALFQWLDAQVLAP